MEFNYKKLKKRPAYPFETIAVGIAFSPKMNEVIAEALRLSVSLHASLILIHIGKKTTDKEEELEQILNKLGADNNKVRVIWMQGDPVELILKICKMNVVDLLILGALEKENLFKYYMGSIARTISRRAKCSILLLNQGSPRKRSKKIIVNGFDNPKTIHTIQTCRYLAESDGVSDIVVVREVNVPTLAMAVAESSTAPEATKIKKELTKDETDKLEELLEKVKSDKVEISIKSITGKPGFAISNYARTKNAELLVVNSPDTKLGILDRIFTHDIEYVLADLPCNLLIVHSRI